MGFWPTGPITTTMAVIILVTATAFLLWGKSEQRFIAAGLVISWIGSRYATLTSDPIGYGAFLTIAGLCSFCAFTDISRWITVFYGARIAIIAALVFGFIDWFWLWEVNLWLVGFQILLAWGTISSGPGRLSRNRNDGDSLFAGWPRFHMPSAFLRSQKPHLHQADQARKEQGH